VPQQFTPNGMEVMPGQRMTLAKSVEVTVIDEEGWDIGGQLYKKGEKVSIDVSEHAAAKKRYPGKFEGADPKPEADGTPAKPAAAPASGITVVHTDETGKETER